MKMSNENLIIPVYIDNTALFNLIASIDGGFSMVEKVTTTGSMNETTNSASRSLNIELNTPILKIGAAPKEDKSKGEETSKIIEAERYYTTGYLLVRLRNHLLEKNILKQFSGKL